MRRRRNFYALRNGEIGLHSTDTELGFYRGFAAGYRLAIRDQRNGKRLKLAMADPNRSKAFVYGATTDRIGHDSQKEKPDEDLYPNDLRPRRHPTNL